MVREHNTRRRPLLGQDNNALILLIAVNALLFIILQFLRLIYTLSYEDGGHAENAFFQQVLDWFQVPASLTRLSTRPWVLLVYMFTQYKVSYFIGSMLWLFGFGYIMQDLTGNNKLIPIYLYGGVLGAAFFLLAVNTFPHLADHINNIPSFIGSGAAVVAIAIATTVLSPGYRIFPFINGGIPLWILTLVFIVFDYVSIKNENAGVAMAHLASGAVGFVFIDQLKRGRDLGAWMTSLVHWLDDLFNPEKKLQPKDKQRLFYKSDKEPYKKTHNLTQQKLDDILDKINKDGYHMLTNEEKDFLNRASKEEL